MERRLQGTRDEVAALKDLLQSMLQLENINDKADIDHIKRLQPKQLRSPDSGNSSDGYSPVSMMSGEQEFPAPNHRPAPVAPMSTWDIQSYRGIASKATRNSSVATRMPEAIRLSPNATTVEEQLTHDKNTPLVTSPKIAGDLTEFTNDGETETSQWPPSFVSRKSVALLRKSERFEPDFQTRMQSFQQKTRQKKEELRQRAVTEEQSSMQPTPEINRSSKRLRRNLSHLFSWQNQKESKLSRLRAAEVTRQAEECDAKPVAKVRSGRAQNDHLNDLAQCRVEDRLQLFGLIYQNEKEEQIQQHSKQAQRVAVPRLAPHTLNLARSKDKPAFERLHKQHQRKYAPKSPQSEAEVESPMRKLPKCDHEQTVRRLYTAAARYKQRQIERRDKQSSQMANMQRMPKLSERSQKLASKKRKESNDHRAATFRLCSCCSHPQTSCEQTAGDHSIRVGKRSAGAIFDKHIRWQQQREARRLIEKQRSDELELEECTFRNPLYRPASGPVDLKSQSTHPPGNDAFYRRSVAWAAEREQFLDAEKKIWEELEMMHCPFKPKIPARADCNSKGVDSPRRLAKRKTFSQKQHALVDARSSARLSPAARRYLLDYTARDLEALASSPSYSDHSFSFSEQLGNETPRLPRVSRADAQEFAGR